jgi:hypothetical protein
MATDAAKHTVPAGSDHPSRADLLKLWLSIRDAIPIANTAGRATQLASLAAATPAVAPSASTPVLFYQQDLPAGYRYIYTVDGSNFISLSGAFVWADATARGLATTMAAGDKGYQVDTKVTYRYDGTAWKGWDSDWLTFTSTFTNLTFATGVTTWALRYRFEQGTVHVTSVPGTPPTLGTGFVVGTGPVLTHPVTAAAILGAYAVMRGGGHVYDTSGIVAYPIRVSVNNGSAASGILWASGTSGISVSINSTTPVAFAAGDELLIDYYFDPA